MADNPFDVIENIYNQAVEEADLNGNADLFKRVTDFFFEDLNSDINNVPFTFTDIEYLNGYYIFGMGTNSVIHFHVKECPGWKFGIWWDEPKDDNFIPGRFFAQFEENIDKFKPSASIFYEEFTIDDSQDRYHHSIFKVKEDLEFIKNEPYLAFCRDYCYCDYNKTYVSREEAKKIYDDWREKTDKGIELTKKWDEKILKWVEDNIVPLFKGARIIDRGAGWYPRYDVFAPFEENKDVVEKPGCYSWFANDDEQGKILTDTFHALYREADKETENITYYFPPCHDSITFCIDAEFKELTEVLNND